MPKVTLQYKRAQRVETKIIVQTLHRIGPKICRYCLAVCVTELQKYCQVNQKFGQLFGRLTCCQEQDLENVASTSVQPPGTLKSDLHDITS